MSMYKLTAKIVTDKQGRTFDFSPALTLNDLYKKVSNVYDLPTSSFKILNQGRPVKNDASKFIDAAIADDAKLNVMVTEKVSLDGLNALEAFVAETAGDDQKKKSMALLRMRKVLEKHANHLSLDDLQRLFAVRAGGDDVETTNDVFLPDDVRRKLVDTATIVDFRRPLDAKLFAARK